MTKQELRQSIRSAVAALPAAQRSAESAAATARIEASPEWQRAGVVLLYRSMADEIDTSRLIDDALRSGKRVVLPATHGQDLDALLAQAADIDLAIIPGRAFTADGLRLGRGRGYYDRLLPALRCPTFGVGFACQMVDSLPCDPWDVRLTAIV